MKAERPNNRASTEIQALLVAAGVMVAVVATIAVRQFIYGFYTDPAASAEQVSNVANGIGNVVSTAPGVVFIVLAAIALAVRTLE